MFAQTDGMSADEWCRSSDASWKREEDSRHSVAQLRSVTWEQAVFFLELKSETLVP